LAADLPNQVSTAGFDRGRRFVTAHASGGWKDSQMTTNNTSQSAPETAAPGPETAAPSGGIIDCLGFGVFVFDLIHRLYFTNRTGLALLGCCGMLIVDPSEIRGVAIEQVFADDSFPGWAEQLKVLGAEEGGQITLAARVPGRELVFAAQVSLICPTCADFDGWIVALLDITQSRQADTHLSDLERSCEKGVMASHITHDINNFLGLILGASEMAQMSVARGKVDKAAAYIEKFPAHVARMEQFAQRLIAYTRLESQKTKTNLNAVAADMLSFALGRRRFQGIRLTGSFDPAIPDAELDSDQLAQLLIHLFNNSADALAEAKPPNPFIQVATRLDGDAMILSVADNGIGVPPKIKDKLFQKHFSTKPGHLGYGLVSCFRILDNHAATTAVQSEPLTGTTIEIRIPRKQERPESADDI